MGELPNGRQRESAYQGEVKELFVTGFKMLLDDGGVVGGERKKFCDLRPVAKVARANDFNPESDREV